MKDVIEYECRKLNLDRRRARVINSAFTDTVLWHWREAGYSIAHERIYTLYCIEDISTDLYNALVQALMAAYNYRDPFN